MTLWHNKIMYEDPKSIKTPLDISQRYVEQTNVSIEHIY